MTAGGGQMVGHRLAGGSFHIGFGPGAAAGGGRVHPPVVEHLRNVQRLGRRVAALHLIDEAQEQVVVLGAVTFRTLAAHRFKQFPPEHRQMADVVDSHQIFRGIIRLEVAHPRALGRLFK